MTSSSDCSSSDGDTRNQKASRKKRKVRDRSLSGDRRRGSQRENDNYRENYRRSNADRNERRNYYHKDSGRHERKRRLESSPPRRVDNRGRHKDGESGFKRDREDNNQNRQRDTRDRRPKSSFEQVRVKKESSPEWGKPSVKREEKAPPQEKEKPNFGLSGKLTEDTNTVNGVVIKYAPPSDSAKPKKMWRLYQFKGEKSLQTLYVHRQPAYLMGRDRKIADIPLDHPSISKQHAALQYRLVPFTKQSSSGQPVTAHRVRPYLIDLESANGTFVNDVKLEPRRFHELLERDVIKFGFSTREYVLLHEKSKNDALDDDVPMGPE